MSNILDLIQQQREIDNEAWQTFNSEYERRNPPPQQKSNWLTVGMWSGLIAALVLSGLMTIPSFSTALQGAKVWYPLALVGGVAGFIAIDLVMFFSTYSFTTMYYRPKAIEGKLNLKELMIVIGIAGIFGFIVSAGSNFYMMFNGYHVFEDESEEQHNFTLGIAFLLALAPPVQATATGSILALAPLYGILERDAYERSKQGAWSRFRQKYGISMDIQRVIDKQVELAEKRLDMPQNTVSDSLGQSNGLKTLNVKGAIHYIKLHESELDSVLKTVLDENPNATQSERAMALAEAINGDSRGYKTVIRAYKSLGKDV